VHSSNDGGGACVGERRQKETREEGDSDFRGKGEDGDVGRVEKELMVALAGERGLVREESRDDERKRQGSYQERSRRCEEG
jgi:hypothetical protein